MECPFCRSLNSKVLNTRLTKDQKSNRRRRQCDRCGRRFTTLEGVIPVVLTVIKKGGGRREGFNTNKLVKALERAAKGRLDDEKIEEIINAVCSEIAALGRKEMQSYEIGELLLERLAQEDDVSYMRFASFFREFTDKHDFISAIEELESREK